MPTSNLDIPYTVFILSEIDVLVIKVLVPSFFGTPLPYSSTCDEAMQAARLQTENPHFSTEYRIPSFFLLRNSFHRRKDSSGKEIRLHGRQRRAHNVQQGQDVSLSPVHLARVLRS